MKCALALIVALTSSAMASPHPPTHDKDVVAMCAKVRALINRVGVERAIQIARRRGYTEAQIAAAQVCL